MRDKPILGLTILDKELFVASDDSSDIEVYNYYSTRLAFSHRFKLQDLVRAWSMASCPTNKCLYIMDLKDDDHANEILKVGVDGNLLKSWSAEADWGFGLSVTDESNIILTVYEKNNLNEYSPEGQLIRKIQFSSDAGILHPRHAVKLANGHFVVTHGYDNDPLHRVCLLDEDGKVTRSFGGKRGHSNSRMDLPFGLIVTGNEFIVVADVNNSRVLLLGCNLEFEREIISREKQMLRLPMTIQLDESDGRLFVAENEWNSDMKVFRDGRVLLFDVK